MRILTRSKNGGDWECDIGESDPRYRDLAGLRFQEWRYSSNEEDLDWLMTGCVAEVNIVEKS